MKEIVFENRPCFGNPNSFLDFMKEQQRKPNPLIRTILLLKLGDLEIVYPILKPLQNKGKMPLAHRVGKKI